MRWKAMGVTTLLFVNMSVSRAAAQTAEDLYQVDRLNGGPSWQRQCALSEKDCMRELSQVALQLAFDLRRILRDYAFAVFAFPRVVPAAVFSRRRGRRLYIPAYFLT